MVKIFIEDTKMETQTIFMQNGDIHIHPCSFELGQDITERGSRVIQRGRMITDPDGTSVFRGYAEGGAPRVQRLVKTPHAELKSTKHRLSVTFNFPHNVTRRELRSILRDEIEDVISYIENR